MTEPPVPGGPPLPPDHVPTTPDPDAPGSPTPAPVPNPLPPMPDDPQPGRGPGEPDPVTPGETPSSRSSPSAHGIHDTLTDPGLVDTLICDALG